MPLKDINNVAPQGNRPARVRVAQFGEGNFLRAFVDWMIDVANERLGLDAGVTVVQPIKRGMVDTLVKQDGLYTVLLRGKQDGVVVRETRVVRSIIDGVNPYTAYADFLALARNPDLAVVASNTTEAGIVYTGTDSFYDEPPASFPGKLTRFLYERWSAALPGLAMLPCELIDGNGDALRDCVRKTAAQWNLPPAFQSWLMEENEYLNTLVDRIVTGFPRDEAEALWDELGYRDALLDVAEPFGLWVIQDSTKLREALPLDKAGLPVVFTPDVTPYKLRKVRMLNGAHTSMVHAAFLCGLDTVGDCMADPAIRAFTLRALREEIMPTLTLDPADLAAFADSIVERFENPFNRHQILSITLNSLSKFRARVLPSIDAYMAKERKAPPLLSLSFASLLAFYHKPAREKDGAFPLQDDADALALVDALADEERGLTLPGFVRALLTEPPACIRLWGGSLDRYPGLVEAVERAAERIEYAGIRAALEAALL
ncbi:MAG: tagaturonate reductase [Oscillospiraceae bacterium]|jgi:tagaturonate reductase|nr:tagaturonate reductase [Oscillospiraceae bacterium]